MSPCRTLIQTKADPRAVTITHGIIPPSVTQVPQRSVIKWQSHAHLVRSTTENRAGNVLHQTALVVRRHAHGEFPQDVTRERRWRCRLFVRPRLFLLREIVQRERGCNGSKHRLWRHLEQPSPACRPFFLGHGLQLVALDLGLAACALVTPPPSDAAHASAASRLPRLESMLALSGNWKRYQLSAGPEGEASEQASGRTDGQTLDSRRKKREDDCLLQHLCQSVTFLLPYRAG